MGKNKFSDLMDKIYSNDNNEKANQELRFSELLEFYKKNFQDEKVWLFSTPGRTEIGGNHTDHNHGRVLAGSVNLDTIAVAAPVENNIVTLFSEGYSEAFKVNLDNLSKAPDEEGTTAALIRGVAAFFRKNNFQAGGFNAVVSSRVPVGSGLSSSASFEVLIATIFNHFYNGDKVPVKTMAIAGQFAENEFFGKPCGLMDQMACAYGGIVEIDFKNPRDPQTEQVDFSLKDYGYNLIVVNTGGSHADLTDDYAAIPAEMKKVAAFFGKRTLRDIKESEFFQNLSELRKKTGDRAVLRAQHFLAENKRVLEQIESLKNKDIVTFFKLIIESGNSSFRWLQNIFSTKQIEEQGVAVALALTERFISGHHPGACRVHGGGFAGTIQVFIHRDDLEEYINEIGAVFGKESVTVLSIRKQGTVCLGNLEI